MLQSQSLESANDYVREARRRIQRMNLINTDLEVKGQSKYSKTNFNDPYNTNSPGGFASGSMGGGGLGFFAFSTSW